jgi:glyoxylase-like metal-dependent hydrolase (beta-lactamase superfamily II)
MSHNPAKISAIKFFAFITILLFFTSCSNKKAIPDSSSWCERELRPELKKLTEVKTKRNWFKVYFVGDDVYAIAEPYNYQEVISWLIIGRDRALLFDTGMGMDSISFLVKELTTLPIIVLNSHTHYDHIGGNHEFANVFAMNTAFTKKNAANGYAHNMVEQEVAPDAFCLKHLPEMDTAHYYIRSFSISTSISDGDTVDLGRRAIKIIAAPGHTPDGIALLDEKSGYLWTGDNFYEGPVFLFSEGTDLAAYEKSMEKLALIAPKLQHVFPSHNTPVADPRELIDACHAFQDIKNGRKKGKENADKTVLFEFNKFSFLIDKNLLNFK